MRIVCRATLLLSVALVGCSSPPPPTEEAPPNEYPVRADWLVVAPPKATPREPFSAGLTPLAGLDPLRTDSAFTPAGPSSLLVPEVKGRAILDTSEKGLAHLKPDPRPLLAAGLRALFGTPADPTVGLSPARLRDLIAAKEAERKQPGLKEEQKETLESEITELKERAAEFEQQQPIVAELGLDDETLKHGGRLFRTYCQQCHGATGDGGGPSAPTLFPQPRDYRQGLFKFISTKPDPQGVRPRRADLHRTIRHGLDGTAMLAYSSLTDAEIEALVSYVLHLSIRGECEYQWLKIAADRTKADDIVPERAFFDLADTLKKVLPVWQRSNQAPVEIAADPYETPDEQLRAAARGHAVFLDATQGGCVSCHTNYGRSANLAFDSWGGVARPRDLTAGLFRVSRHKDDLYTRLYCGIPGVNMPSHADALKLRDEDKAAGRDRIWDVVHFVRAISDPATRRELERKYGVRIE
ncbi:MAG TPA: c-type cytochrome [Gemmataceae bacterium]|nr:c-type cytochrome [Gemmataceae bacterium]